MESPKPFILALTGAGISKASGIPTFQDIPGIKDKLDVRYRAQHPEEFDRVVQQMKDNMRGKEPNAAHRALAAHDIPVVTMNVDGLHQKAGSKTVVECHGNLEDGTMVLYGEQAFYEQAFDLLQRATNGADKRRQEKILLVIGTSYETQFANAFVQTALYHGWALAEINHDAEHLVAPFLERNLGA